MSEYQSLEDLLVDIRRCQLCAERLALGPRPVLQASSSARLLIVGQAPGSRVHASGIPWDDPSGERLRDWLGMDKTTFYDASRVAIVPMGFCYPGRGKSGDLPPDPACAPQWHSELMGWLRQIELTLLIGNYAQRYYLNSTRNLTETVRHWRDYAPQYLPLPHPSPRNNIWLRRNPWFEVEVLPELRRRVLEAFS
ncbi:uracil-DNA glycosylase family protein [Parahaliea sp. F7430]|uniref:Uracil-DNA glycosylase family protein n=1 Tax=Sediminihaliea albiluteola TaxID=2758564 RepID=A0A7W2TTK8_9GAMM|nr:uracil-DNA glycosylase family protein [Sediminihaliea albiluteola]MBA6411744.1 uracil-DNA glycosylase family protein [Sediminihaliea albiluteola]